jgi:hypothetical protein
MLNQLGQGASNGVQPQSAGNGAGRCSSGSFTPLEVAPTVEGATGPDPRLVAVAEQYAAANGIPLGRQAEYAKIDPERGGLRGYAARTAKGADITAIERQPLLPSFRSVRTEHARYKTVGNLNNRKDKATFA